MKNLPIQFKILILIVILISIFIPTISVYNKATEFYNNVTKLNLEYVSLEQKQSSNYEALYESFKARQTNCNLNKEAFIEVTKIIMSNRKDGNNLAWKWNQENQQIPFEEFTYFYKQLDAVIADRYQDYMNIEDNKQEIVKQYNYLIKSYPNNIYNRWFVFKELKYNKFKI